MQQMLGVFEVWIERLMNYYTIATQLAEYFYIFSIEHVKRRQNSQVDALAKLALVIKLPPTGKLEIVVKHWNLLPIFGMEETGMVICKSNAVEENRNNDLEKEDWR